MIPQFEALFKGFGADLPAFTQFVINMSRGLQDNGIFIAVVVGRRRLRRSSTSQKRSQAMREFLDRAPLKFPIIGPILYKAAIARFARTLSTMFAAGVPLVEALESVAGATGNIVFENAVHEDARRSRHRSAPAARDGKHRPVPEHGHPDDRGR